MSVEETNISSEAQSFLEISEEEVDKLANRLGTFISSFRGNFASHTAEFRNNFPKETKRWDSFLKLTSTDQIPGGGVGKTFLVVWNGNGIDVNQDGKFVDVEIWVAKGLREDDNSGNLIVSYYSIGYLEAGSWKFIGKPLSPFRKQGENSIFPSTKVILD